jgi:hypothetical protein
MSTMVTYIVIFIIPPDSQPSALGAIVQFSNNLWRLIVACATNIGTLNVI